MPSLSFHQSERFPSSSQARRSRYPFLFLRQVYPQSAPLGVRWVGPETVGSKGDGDISIHLLQQDLWAKFHSLGTEMIITKNGRFVKLLDAF